MPVNLIPLMTADNAPTGTASARHFLTWEGDQMRAYRAMNGDPSLGGWHSENWGSAAEWLRYQFISPVIATGYMVQSAETSTTWNPESWYFQGSNDGTNWTNLDDQFNITPKHTFTTAEKKYFSFWNITPFIYYQLGSMYSVGKTMVRVGAWEIYGTDPTEEPGSALTLGRYCPRRRALVGVGGRHR